MTGTPLTEELTVIILVFLILLILGMFFILRGMRLPGNFEANEKKRKELKKKAEEAEEKAQAAKEKPEQS
jgi:Tfp pilus assembly protein PilO